MQNFHFVPVEVAVNMTANPLQQFECACHNCTAITTVFLGRLVQFHNGDSLQYRMFCSEEHALAAMPVEWLNT